MATQTQEQKPKWRYDVFLCFRGEDTRHTFTGNLYNALTHKNFRTFMDHEGLKTGEHISFIHKALEESRIAILVLSEDFATSSYCLHEILEILKWKETKNQLVLPIFYDVDPSDVSCGESESSKFKKDIMDNFQERFGPKKLQECMSALSHVAQLAPQWLQYKKKKDVFEYKFIEEIVEWVTKNVPRCDIFLSFRGKDTRYPFIDFLHDALLSSERFNINMHDEASENNDDQISQSLSPIKKSWLSIIVFSENYACCLSCLEELDTILECKKRKNQLVWPIFYKLEPSELRHRKDAEKWSSALSEVANMKGSYLKTGYEYEVIEKIVKGAINAMYIRSP